MLHRSDRALLALFRDQSVDLATLSEPEQARLLKLTGAQMSEAEARRMLPALAAYQRVLAQTRAALGQVPYADEATLNNIRAITGAQMSEAEAIRAITGAQTSMLEELNRRRRGLGP